MYQIDFYEDENGNSDVEDFIKKLDSSNQLQDKQILKKIYHQLELLGDLGYMITMPQSRNLKGYKYPLKELRPLPERIFYAAWANDRFVLLSHYTKKGNKTDPREIDKALRRLEDWLERNK